MTEPDDRPATLTDEEIETRYTGRAHADADTGDDTGDTSDTSDTGDDSGDTSDTSDTGDDSGSDA